MEPDEVAELLMERAQGCGRAVPWREIAGAVRSAGACAWQLTDKAGSWEKFNKTVYGGIQRWPQRNEAARRRILSEDEGLAELWELSRSRLEDVSAEEVIDLLFPGNPLLCCGWKSSEFDARPREEWRGQLAEMALIVPSPMSARTGKTQEGKVSTHTLSNTGPRTYLVCEFDQGTADEHACLLAHLEKFTPLACAVHSGGKSLHGWFVVAGENEGLVQRFFEYAVSLGADPATWTRSQFVRMPGGLRENGVRQEIYYFNPKVAGRE